MKINNPSVIVDMELWTSWKREERFFIFVAGDAKRGARIEGRKIWKHLLIAFWIGSIHIVITTEAR